jgi:hypothetical protein
MSFVIDPLNSVLDSIQETWDPQAYNDQGYIYLNFTGPGQGLFGERTLKVDYEVSFTSGHPKNKYFGHEHHI